MDACIKKTCRQRPFNLQLAFAKGRIYFVDRSCIHQISTHTDLAHILLVMYIPSRKENALSKITKIIAGIIDCMCHFHALRDAG